MVADAHLPMMTFGEEKESGRKAEVEEESIVVSPHTDDVLLAVILEKLWQSWPKKRVIN